MNSQKGNHSEEKPNFPFSAWVKGIPGLVGIRLEASPTYQSVLIDNEVEVRDYLPMALAQVTLPGPFESFRENGFDMLASYLFGKNSESKNIDMSTPIFFDRFEDHWTMSFVLPFLAVEAPHPIDGRIRITSRPRTTVAVATYHGNNTLELMEKHADALRAKVAAWPKTPAYSVQFAQYDGPATVPFLKKNEIHLILEDDKN
jgi:hypothetical protein